MTPDIIIVVEFIQIPVEHPKCSILNQVLKVISTAVLEDPFIERKETAWKYDEMLCKLNCKINLAYLPNTPVEIYWQWA